MALLGTKLKIPSSTNHLNVYEQYDIIGDIHGCYDELIELLNNLGYYSNINWNHPDGRRLIILGDFIDRGPKIRDVINLIVQLTRSNEAICLLGNHEVTFLRYLEGTHNIQVKNGLECTLAQLNEPPDPIRTILVEFIKTLLPIKLLARDSLIVTHAGLLPNSDSLSTEKALEFALFGSVRKPDEIETDMSRSKSWIRNNRRSALIVYGHYAARTVCVEGQTICIDTGCVFGGSLTAMRFPEKTIVSVPARKIYYQPPKYF